MFKLNIGMQLYSSRNSDESADLTEVIYTSKDRA